MPPRPRTRDFSRERFCENFFNRLEPVEKVISDYEAGRSKPIIKTMTELEKMAHE